RPLRFQERFGPAVAALLSPVSSYQPAAVMPDHRRRAESQRPAPLGQTPAHVHVVSSDAELRIESANGLQIGLAKGHVASRDVFRLAIGNKDMDRAAGGAGDTVGDRPVTGRRYVWSSDRCV